jgi:hypothetical protein
VIDVEMLAKALGGDGEARAETVRETVVVCVRDGRSSVFIMSKVVVRPGELKRAPAAREALRG